MVEEGIPISSVEILRNEGLTFSEVHGVVLPARTLKHRKDKKQPLSPEEADCTLRIAKILALADRVFGNHDKALRWLRVQIGDWKAAPLWICFAVKSAETLYAKCSIRSMRVSSFDPIPCQ